MRRDEIDTINSLRKIFGRDLTEYEKKKIVDCHADIKAAWIVFNNAKIRAIEIMRELCRKNGLMSEKLKDLRSKKGLPFVMNRKVKFLNRPYKNAISGKGDDSEMAYFCGIDKISDKVLAKFFSENEISRIRCGWVKGEPRRVEEQDSHHDIPRCAHYYCHVCGDSVGTQYFRGLAGIRDY